MWSMQIAVAAELVVGGCFHKKKKIFIFVVKTCNPTTKKKKNSLKKTKLYILIVINPGY